MRRRIGATIAAGGLLALTLAGCNGGGGISLPTNIPTSIPTSITLPTLPTQTQTSVQTLPRTETSTVTVTPTPTPTARPSTTTAAPVPVDNTSSGLPVWLWVLLVLLLLLIIALIVWLVRRSRARAAWDERLANARQHAAWVEDSLVPQVVSRGTTAEAAATWHAAGPRLLTVDEELHDLSATAPDEERAAAVNQLRSRLAALVQAVGADTETATDATVDDLRARRATVQRARTDLRNELNAANAANARRR